MVVGRKSQIDDVLLESLYFEIPASHLTTVITSMTNLREGRSLAPVWMRCWDKKSLLKFDT